jgi:aspartate oxidase
MRSQITPLTIARSLEKLKPRSFIAKNAALAASLVAKAALKRSKSLGTHYLAS